MSKLFRSILSAALAFSLVFSITVFAGDVDHSAASEKGLYILTESVPQEAVRHAQEVFHDIISDMIDSPIEHYALGTPFAYYYYSEKNHTLSTKDAYGFPVFYDGTEVFGTIDIFLNHGQYYACFTRDMLSGLSQLIGKSDTENPFAIVCAFDKTFAINGEEELNLFNLIVSDGQQGAANRTTKKSLDYGAIRSILENINHEGIDVLEEIQLPLSNTRATPIADRDSISGLSLLRQAVKHWGSASVALIGYCKSKSLTAEDVTKAILGSAKDEGITNAQVMKLAKDSYSIYGLTEVSPF